MFRAAYAQLPVSGARQQQAGQSQATPLQRLQRLQVSRRLPPPPPPPAGQRRRRCLLLPAAAARRDPGYLPLPHEEGGRTEQDDMDMWMDRLAGMRPTWRSVAVQQLLRIEQEGAYAGLVSGSPASADTDELGGMGDGRRERGSGGASVGGGGGSVGGAWGGSWSRQLSPQDARLVTHVVTSVTRWRRRLDYLLARFSKRPLEELDAPLRQILRIAALELVERNAPSHTVNEHVELAKRVMHRGAGSATNGMLRSICRARDAGALPTPPPPAKGQSPAEAADALAVGASHPTWLVEAWLQQYGPQATMQLLQWNNQPPRYALRLAPDQDPAAVCERLKGEGVQARPSEYLPADYLVVEGGMQALLSGGTIARGEGQVQDEAAGLVVAMVGPQPGEAFLDACAAPGGKTLYAAARMQGSGSILALDVSPPRLAALRGMAARQAHGGMVRTHAADLRAFAAEIQAERARQAAAAAGGGGEAAPAATSQEEEEQEELRRRAPLRTQWDRVLLDAPCSGTGVLAKRADLRWRKTPADVAQMASLQGELLHAAAGLVAPGGVLVYSTCSLEAAENQRQVAAFLAGHPEFSVEAPPPESGVPPQCLSPEGFLTMLPHVHGTDGAFAARLRRRGGGGAAAEVGAPAAA